MKTWILIGIGAATLVIGYVIYASFIKKDLEEFKGGGKGYLPTTTKTSLKTYM